jgi:GntR family transcriptional regulator/MocR family aminotransferase
LQRQLLRRVRDAILGGAMPAGTRLPGTRALADTLGVSRNTTAAVYEQLVAEGFLQSDRRGTRVVGLSRPAAPRRPAAPPAVAQRLGRIRPSLIGSGESEFFRPGVPALSHFPVDAWRHAIDARCAAPVTSCSRTAIRSASARCAHRSRDTWP